MSITPDTTAATIIAALRLERHPEGGWFRETWRAPAEPGARAAGTAIYYLLEEDDRSHWHRVDAAEVWHHYAGAPLMLSIAAPDGPAHPQTLGPDIAGGARPQIVVPPGHWQSARPVGGWTLAGCTVAPGFEFARFELAPPGWAPPGAA